MSGQYILPPFYKMENAFNVHYEPDPRSVFLAAQDAKQTHAWSDSAEDEQKICLIIIDGQRDFCFPSGSLYVAGHSGKGAMEDNDRLARFIYRETASLSKILPTFDSHRPFQIFFSSFWQDRHGQAVPPHSVITAAEIANGTFTPAAGIASLCGLDAESLREYALHYCQSLEADGKYALYIWPEHCLLGSLGHSLAGVLQEARLFHAYARKSSNDNLLKGDLILSENYSVFSPEVQKDHKGQTIAGKNTPLLDQLLSHYDGLIFAGQAGSHCVRSSLLDLAEDIKARDPDLAKKCYLLTDCMSPVVIRDPAGAILADFSSQQDALFEQMDAFGMTLITSDFALESFATKLGRE